MHQFFSPFCTEKCFWDAKGGRGELVGKAEAESVETTAYALLSMLSVPDMKTAKLAANWLTEQRKYGGGFQSTQVGCRIILTLSPPAPPIAHPGSTFHSVTLGSFDLYAV